MKKVEAVRLYVSEQVPGIHLAVMEDGSLRWVSRDFCVLASGLSRHWLSQTTLRRARSEEPLLRIINDRLRRHCSFEEV